MLSSHDDRHANNMIARTFDFLRRQAMHAVLTHLRLLAADESLSFLRDLDLFGCDGDSVELALLWSGLSWLDDGLVTAGSACGCGWFLSMGQIASVEAPRRSFVRSCFANVMKSPFRDSLTRCAVPGRCQKLEMPISLTGVF